MSSGGDEEPLPTHNALCLQALRDALPILACLAESGHDDADALADRIVGLLEWGDCPSKGADVSWGCEGKATRLVYNCEFRTTMALCGRCAMVMTGRRDPELEFKCGNCGCLEGPIDPFGSAEAAQEGPF